MGKKGPVIRRRQDDERGIAMLAAVICLLVVVTLSAVGLQQSLGSLSSGAQSRKLQQNLDAAEAGLQAELDAIGNVASGTNASPVLCSSGHTAIQPTGVNGITSYYNATLTPETSTSISLTPAPCSGNYSQSTISSDPYVLITSTGTTSDPQAGGTGFGRVLKAVVSVTNTGSTTSYQPNAAAYGTNVTVLGSTFSMAKAVANSTNEGVAQTPSNLQILTGQSVLTAGALGAYAETESNGGSFACAGVVTSPGAIQVGTPSAPCANVTGVGSGNGVTIDLLPLLGSLSGLAADISLQTNALTSWASGTATSAPTGGANLASIKVNVTLLSLLGLGATISATINVPANSPNWNLVQGNAQYPGLLSALNGLVPTLGTLVSGLLSVTTDYQASTPSSGGVGSELQVDALRLSALHGTASADVAEVTVGPNNQSSTTTPANVQVEKIVQSS